MRQHRYAIRRPRDRAWLRDLLTLRGDDGKRVIVGVTWTIDHNQAIRYQSAKAARHVIAQLGEGDPLEVVNQRGRVIP